MPSVDDIIDGELQVNAPWFRLIPSRFPTVDVYRRVAPTERWPILSEVELLTNPRQKERVSILGSDVVDGAPPQLQNWNHAPFVYLDPDGSYLLRGAYGVLELGETKDVALAMAVSRREAFLSATALPPQAIEMRLLKHPVQGKFAVLQGLDQLSEEERWKLGETLYEEWDGAVFGCAAAPRGKMIAVFNSECLGKSVQGDHFRFWWDGSHIRNIYNFNERSNDDKGYDPYESLMAARNQAA